MESYFDLIVTAVLLLVGLVYGSKAEKKHYEDIRKREAALAWMAVRSDKIIGEEIIEGWMVSTSVVIANDFFKSFIAGIKNVFGGRLSSYESLMDRARREALLRIKEHAAKRGAREVVGLRMQFNSLDKLGVEILVSGTAVR